ncbi:hypothetical protein Bca4012_083541 [Brassica carinata]
MKGFVGDIEGRLKATVQLAVQHAMQEAPKSLDVSLGGGLEKMHCALTKTVKDLLSKVSSSSLFDDQGVGLPNVGDQRGGSGVIPPAVVTPQPQAMGSTAARDVVDVVLDEINGRHQLSSTLVGDSARRSSLRLKKTINLGGQTSMDREPVPVKLVAPTLPDMVVEETNPKAHLESVSGDTISPNIGDKSPPNTQTSQEKIIDSPPLNIEPLQPNHADVFPAAVPAVNLGVHYAVEEQTEQQPDVTNSASRPASVEEPNPIRDSLDSEEIHIPYNLLEIPSFSLELSQEQVPDVLVDVNPLNVIMPEEQDDGVDGERRKSKRAWNKPAVLNDFQCDPKIGVIDISPSLSISPIDFSDIALRPQHIGPKVMDALMHYLARQLSSDDSNVQIFDTTLPALLIKQHSCLVKTAVKDRPKLKFSGLYVESIIADLADRLYFPFCIDKQHWVGVCVDIKASAVSILDWNVAFKRESLLKKDLNLVANLMPYIVKLANGMEIIGSQKPFSLNRVKGVPQIANPGDAAVMAVLLIEAHANGGMQALKCITTRILPDAAKQLAVNFYKDISL